MHPNFARASLPLTALLLAGLAACGNGAAATSTDDGSEREAQIYAALIPVAATKQQHDGSRIFVTIDRVPTREGDDPGRVRPEVQERVDELVEADLTWVKNPQDAYVREGGGVQEDGVLLRLGTLVGSDGAAEVIAVTETGNVGGFSATYKAVPVDGDDWRITVLQNGPAA